MMQVVKFRLPCEAYSELHGCATSMKLDVSTVIRQAVYFYLEKKPRNEKTYPPEEILSHLNRKADIPKAFFSTRNNLAPIEKLLETYREREIRRGIDAAVSRKFTKEQLKPEVFFVRDLFEKLLEEPLPDKKNQKAPPPAKKTGLDPAVQRERERAEREMATWEVKN